MAENAHPQTLWGFLRLPEARFEGGIMRRMSSMAQKTRERAALAVFIVLIALIAVALVAYLVAGHSWNVAASSIDDSLGSMEDYTVILFEGLADEESAFGDDEAGEELLAAAEDSYEEKEASVLVLDVDDFSYYEEGLIIQCGSNRIGVFSVDIYTLKREMTAMVEYFQSYDVDFIVVLTPYAAQVDDIEGIDIAVTTLDEGTDSAGETSDGTFYVSVPDAGEVGVVYISPSNVVSAKSIDEV